MAPMMVFGNTLLKSSNDYNNGNERAVIVPQIERKQPKTKQVKSQIKKKKATANKKTLKHIDAIQAENLILNTKYSEDESNECMDRSDMMCNSSPQMNPDSPPIPSDKQDQKLANTPDILSMVLSLKKNALMHDPYVIQFISSIR